MTNTDYDPDYDPEDQYASYLRGARANLSLAQSLSPDEAARSIELEDATNVPATHIARNVKDFEDRQKLAIGQDVIRSNPRLLDYVNSHPLVGAVSQNDWSNLDRVTGTYLKVTDGLEHPWWKRDVNLIARSATGGVADVLSGIGRAVGSENFTAKVEQIRSAINSGLPLTDEEQTGIIANVLTGAGALIPMAVGGLAAAAVAPEAAAVALPFGLGELGAGAFTAAGIGGLEHAGEVAKEAEEKHGEVLGAYTGSLLSSSALNLLPLGVLSRPWEKAAPGLINWTATALKRWAVGGGAQAAAAEMGAAIDAEIAQATYDPNAQYHPDTTRMVSNLLMGVAMGAGYDGLKAYIDSGSHIPYGMNPLIDRLMEEHAKTANKDLDELIKVYGTTDTVQHGVGGLMASEAYLKLHPDASIGIDRDLVNRMYGGQQPEPDDKLFGWIPNIATQMATTTGDIRVSLADLVNHAHQNPDLAKEVNEDIRIGKNGLSLNDIKSMAQAQQAQQEQAQTLLDTPQIPRYVGGLTDSGSPVLDSVRKSTGLDKIIPVSWEFWTAHPKGIVGRTDLSIRNEGAVVPFLAQSYDARGNGEIINLKTLGQTTGAEILQRLDLNKFSPETREIVSFFRDRAAEASGHTPIYLLSESDIYKKLRKEETAAPAGNFDGDPRNPGGPKIFLNATALKNYSDEYIAHIVIHEMAHAATVAQMSAHPELNRMAIQMLEQTRDWVLANEPQLLRKKDPGYSFGVQYAFVNEREFIAQARSDPDFIRVVSRAPLSENLRKALDLPEGRGTVWDGVRHLVRAALEKLGIKIPSTVMDGVLRWSEILREKQTGRPEPKVGEPVVPPTGPPPPEPPLPVGEPLEPPIPMPELFKDYKALGYSKRYWEKTLKPMLDEQLDRDAKWKSEQAEKDSARRTKDWWEKESADIEPAARATVNQRPVIQAERFLRLGIWGDSKVTRRKLDGNLLTKDQRDLLNEEYWSMKRGNLDPDSIARNFGYNSGEEMISDLIGHSQDMKREDMAPTTYHKSLVDAEVNRVMEEKHGSLQENILKEAKDHIIDDRNFSLLSQNMLRIATKAGLQAPLTKEQIKTAAENELRTAIRGHESSEKMIDEAGRSARKAEEAAGKGDYVTELKHAQDHMISFWKAKLMRDYEALEEKGLANAKNHVAREPTAFKDPDAAGFHNMYQLLMNRFSMRTSTDVNDLLNSMRKRGYTGLGDFIDKIQREFPDITIPAPDFLRDIDFGPQQKLNTLSIGQSEALWETLLSLDKQGKDVKKINYMGMKIGLDNVTERIMEELETRGYVNKPRTAGPFTDFLHKMKVYDASSRIIERLLNRIDRNNPQGALNQLINRPLTEAANFESVLEREYGSRFRALGTPKDFKKIIKPPPMLKDVNGRPMQSFSNMNKLTIALNMGNDNNWWKFTDGRNMSDEDSTKLWNWMQSNMSDEEWKWVQGVWNIFRDIKRDHLDSVYLRTIGFPPRDIAARQFTTASGKVMDGGYYPLIADHFDVGRGSRTALDKVEDGPDFFQMQIPNPHAHERTGAVYPLSLSMDHLPDRFYQLIHDIAFKEPLRDAVRIFKDSTVRNGFKSYVGDEYLNAIDSFLARIAHVKTFNSAAAVEGNRMSEFLRQNIMSFYVGLNIGTVLKHGPTALINSARQIGVQNLLRGYKMMYQTNPETGESWKKFIDENSEEIQRRSRDWSERFGGVYKAMTQGTLRERIIEWGSKPVAFSDMLSAYPTWLGTYLKAMDQGLDFGEARFEADRAVRYAHGSTAPTNLPEIATGGGIHAWITSLYHFFGTMLQNRMEIAFKLNDMYNLGRQAELRRAAAILPAVVADVFAYVVWPTAVEEYVTGLGRDDRRGWGQRLFWASAGGLANSAIYARDIVHALEYGVNQEGGLADSALQPLQQAWRDVDTAIKGKKQIYNAKYAGNLIQDIINLTTYKFGTPREVGNLAKYGWDYETGVEVPRTGLMKDWYQWGDVGRGLTHGSQKMSVVRQ